jgi:type IV secretion system protein TrbL
MRYQQVLLVFAFLLLSIGAVQAADIHGVVDELLGKYHHAGEAWLTTLRNGATTVFWILATISLSWTLISMGIKHADMSELVAELCRFIMFTGLFYWLLLNGPEFANKIVASLWQLGGAAGGGNSIYPGDLITLGMGVFLDTIKQINFLLPQLTLVPATVALIILIVCTLIAVNMILLLCAAWVVLYAGIIFLGFGGCRWTSDMAVNYYRTVLGVGVSLMTMQLIISIGIQFLKDLSSSVGDHPDVGQLAIVMCASIILAVIAHRLPQMVAGMATGAGHNGAVGGIGVMTLLGAGIAGASLVRSMGGGAAAAAIEEGTSRSAKLLEERIAAAEAAMSAGSGGTRTENVATDTGSRSQTDRGPYWPGTPSGNMTPGVTGAIEREAMSASAGSRTAGKTASSSQAQSSGGVAPSATGKTSDPPEPPQTRPMTANEARGYPPEKPGEPIDWEDERRRIVRGDGNFWKPEA